MTGKTRYEQILEDQELRPTRGQRIFMERAARRRARAQAAWTEIHAAYEKMGMPHRLFGSLKRGNVHPGSNVDILILGEPEQAERAAAGRVADNAARRHDIPVDIVFACWIVGGETIGLED